MVTTAALWTWNTSGSVPTVSGYPGVSGTQPTKSGVSVADLRSFVGVPIQIYGNPPAAVLDSDVLQMIRNAEDYIEQETGLLLCQTFVASPPAVTVEQAAAVGVVPVSGLYMRQGFDYDLGDAAYDFLFPRAQDEGWMIYSLRYRPVTRISYGPVTPNAIEQISYNYPLLNQYFRVPPSWQVEDHDFGLVRLVPSTNVQMLPLYAMQLAFMGFAESVPGGIWMYYRAGLTPIDYQSRFSFVKQLVMAQAAIQALSTVQGTVNYGATMYSMSIDGVMYQTKFGEKGAFDGLIKNFAGQRDSLMKAVRDKISGPMITTL